PTTSSRPPSTSRAPAQARTRLLQEPSGRKELTRHRQADPVLHAELLRALQGPFDLLRGLLQVAHAPVGPGKGSKQGRPVPPLALALGPLQARLDGIDRLRVPAREAQPDRPLRRGAVHHREARALLEIDRPVEQLEVQTSP